MLDRPPIAIAARMLGMAGLLPQLFALLLIATGIDRALGALIAFAYAMLIVSFIGGVWWGFAMQARDDQARLAALAVVPTLAAFALTLSRLVGMRSDWALVAIGMIVAAMLLIDRLFVARGIAPGGWMGLRIPLSIGLGTLTILAGVLAPDQIVIVYST